MVPKVSQLHLVAALLLLGTLVGRAPALSTAFTYQGRLVDNGTPVDGTCDVKFDLYDAANGGSSLGSQTKLSVTFSDGTFTVSDLDFGSSPFTGDDRWLSISIRCPAGVGSYGTAFSPRQRLTAVPYALFAVTSMADAGSIDFSSGNINLANSTSANDGNILKNNVRFIHNYGTANTFLGAGAGNFSMTGIGNVGLGSSVLTVNTGGDSNVAVGESALAANTSGDANVAVGQAALAENTTGFQNVGVGANALPNVTDGLLNVAVGYNAGAGVTTGDKNIYLGYNVQGVSNELKVMRLGQPGEVSKTYIAGIKGATVDNSGIVGAEEVFVDINNQLGTVLSTARVKRDIRDMGSATDRLMQLRPVTFHYKSDSTNEPQFGLIAEEVNRVLPELVLYDEDGKPRTVRYHQLSSMLLNELQKQGTRLKQQAELIADLTQRLSALEAGTRCGN
jgi:hypothetical protein